MKALKYCLAVFLTVFSFQTRAAPVSNFFPPPGVNYDFTKHTITSNEPVGVLAPGFSANGDSTSAPAMELIDNASAANNKKWWWVASGVMGFYAVNDAGTPGQAGLQINRSGTNITQSEMLAGSNLIAIKNTSNAQVSAATTTVNDPAAGSTTVNIGSTDTANTSVSIGNSGAGLSGSATLTVGSSLGGAAGGAILNLNDGASGAGNFINSDDTFTFNSTSAGNSVNFQVTNLAGTANNTFLVDPNNNSRYTIGNTTGASSAGSFTVRNQSSVAAGTTSMGVETNILGSLILGMVTCTTSAGTLSANGTGPGAPGAIAGAPAVAGCDIRTSGGPLIFAQGTTYIGGWKSTTTGFDLPAPSSGPALNVGGHRSYSGTNPAVSACGTGPAIDSHATDNTGTVTVGTVAAASCTVTFAVAFSTWNHCRITSQSTIASFAYSYTLSAITVTGTSLVGDKFDYDCDGS